MGASTRGSANLLPKTDTDKSTAGTRMADWGRR